MIYSIIYMIFIDLKKKSALGIDLKKNSALGIQNNAK